MTRRLRARETIVLSVIAFSGALHAGNIAGTVLSAQNGKPLAGVVATVQAAGKSALSDSLGGYVLDSLQPGAWSVVFSREGFLPYYANDVYVAGTAEKRLDVELSPSVSSLEKMTVRASSFRKAEDMAGSSKIITADELLRAPGALLDVQRVVQELPSVSSGGDQTNEIVVRGGSPGENLFLLDNIEIPNPNHFANEGSGGGVISLINPLLVKGLTFCAGAPPAQYGDKASSVLDVRLRDGTTSMVLGGVDAGIAGAGLHIEGPLWGGNNFMLSATRSFLDWVAHSSYNNTAMAVPGYWGLQGRIAGSGPAGKWNANGIYGDNNITIDNAREQLGTRGETITSGGAVYATGGTVERYLSERLSGSLTISAVGNTFDRLEYTGARQRDTFYSNASREREQTVKAQVAYDFGSANRLMLGAFGKRCDFSIDIGSSPDTMKRYREAADTLGTTVATAAGPEILAENLRRDAVAYKYGGYASAIVRPAQRIKVVPGLRFDGFTENHALLISPRLSSAFSLTSKCDLTAAMGVQYQQPDYAVLAANPTCPPKRAITGIAGVEYFFDGPGVQCICEAYYKRYDHMPIDSDIISSKRTLMDSFSVSHSVAAIGRGRSYGLELYAQKKLTNELSWTASYSLSKATMDDPRMGGLARRCPADFDFGSTVTLSAGWKKELLTVPWYASLRKHAWFKILSPLMPVADRMEFSARWRYLGGRPYTGETYDTTYRRWYIDPAAPLNGRRYPDYHTLDIRWERRFGFGFLQMMYYFDLQNVYDRSNVWQYLFVDGKPSQSIVYQLPFFPAGGMIIGF